MDQLDPQLVTGLKSGHFTLSDNLFHLFLEARSFATYHVQIAIYAPIGVCLPGHLWKWGETFGKLIQIGTHKFWKV